MCLGSKIKQSEICELGGHNQFVIILSLKIPDQTNGCLWCWKLDCVADMSYKLFCNKTISQKMIYGFV